MEEGVGGENKRDVWFHDLEAPGVGRLPGECPKAPSFASQIASMAAIITSMSNFQLGTQSYSTSLYDLGERTDENMPLRAMKKGNLQGFISFPSD